MLCFIEEESRHASDLQKDRRYKVICELLKKELKNAPKVFLLIKFSFLYSNVLENIRIEISRSGGRKSGPSDGMALCINVQCLLISGNGPNRRCRRGFWLIRLLAQDFARRKNSQCASRHLLIDVMGAYRK